MFRQKKRLFQNVLTCDNKNIIMLILKNQGRGKMHKGLKLEKIIKKQNQNDIACQNLRLWRVGDILSMK